MTVTSLSASLQHQTSATKECLSHLTLILLNLSILVPPRNASTPNADKTRHSFGNADRVFSFYLTAQRPNNEHVSKQSWL